MLLVNNKAPKMLFFDIQRYATTFRSDFCFLLMQLHGVIFVLKSVKWFIFNQTMVTKSLTMHVQFEFEFLFLGN